jgi:hypothetical protein
MPLDTHVSLSDYHIQAEGVTVQDLFKEFYAVPDFQREYVWKPSNVEELLSDIWDELYDQHNNPVDGVEYFIGSLVVYRDAEGVYQLIDGQQRTTTLFMILCILRDHLPKGETLVAGMIQHAKIVDDDEVPTYRVRLLYPDSKDTLVRIAEGDQPALDALPPSESVKNLRAAYNKAREFLIEKLGSAGPRWKQFRTLFTRKVRLIRIETPSQSSALRVFETINNTGVGLSPIDLLKNLLFRQVKEHEFEGIKNDWKRLTSLIEESGEKPLRFLRYFLHSRYDTETEKPIPENKLYDWMAAKENAKKLEILTHPQRFLTELIRNAEVYRNLSAKKDPAGKPNRYLANIQRISARARQHFILLLAAQHLRSDLFDRLCREIENLFFCVLLTEKNSKFFESSFYREAAALRKIAKDDATAVEAFIEQKLRTEIAKRAAQFETEMLHLSLETTEKYRVRYVLAKLTQWVNEVALPVQTDLGQYLDANVQLEHILPEKAKEEGKFDRPADYGTYVQRLGNLALLEQSLNASIKNQGFAHKATAYRQSSFLLTKCLVEKPHVGQQTKLNQAVKGLTPWSVWNSATIEGRQEQLAALAFTVWSIPKPPKTNTTKGTATTT